MRLPLLVAAALLVLVSCGTIPPASLEFVGIQPEKPKLGDVVTVQFKAVDSRGIPQAGAPITFRCEPQSACGDAKAPLALAPVLASTNKGDGIAATQIVANGRPTSVIVVAESGGVTALSPPITFAGTIPSARQLTFQCGEAGGTATGGIHAIQAYDETRTLIAGIKLRCTAHVADRNGDGIDGVQVSFLTEAGAIGPTETSKTDVIGNATILHKTALPVPKEVGPETFTWLPPSGNGALRNTGVYVAPLWMYPFDWHVNPLDGAPADGKEPVRDDPIRKGPGGKPFSNNPRDNLVTMIAITTGEEGFVDANNNGRWDGPSATLPLGEEYEDLTEPFVDANDNGTRDPDEIFVDANNDGEWTQKNGRWDPSTLIWVQERILWTGMPADADTDLTKTSRPVFRQFTPPVTIEHFGTANATIAMCDPWFNTMAQNGNSDACELQGSKLVVAEPSQFNGPGFNFTYPACTFVTAGVTDAHDPTETDADGGQVPAFNPPLPFTAAARCRFTASREDDLITTIIFPMVSGTVK